ncbi:NAD(P)-dependent oxidoreductase [Agrococcus lahaulensis]|nr:NAD(P)-dependent oxidoreductase [Agrococcus lahaulensis]
MATATIIGLGEAGALYARGLAAAGFEVLGYDPYTHLADPTVTQHVDLAAAVAPADLVITLVGARAARAVTEDVLEALEHTPVLADFNTGSPELKRDLGALAAASGVPFVDVAVLAPVPRAGAMTPLMVSGDGADRFVELFAPVGAEVESIAGAPGDAAARKLLRSAFMKGFAGVILESVNGAEVAGCGAWLRGQIVAELSGDADAFVERLIVGSRQHAERRVHEVADASDYLRSIGQPSWSTDAAGHWLRRLRDEPRTTPGDAA